MIDRQTDPTGTPNEPSSAGSSPMCPGLYVLACALRAGQRVRAARAWVVQHRPGAWRELPWVLRATGGLHQLRRRQLAHDAEFLARWRDVERWEKRMPVTGAIALGVGFGAIAADKLCGWHGF